MVTEDNVIDNQRIVLKDELLKILPETSEASIAVGYFFISGLSAIIAPLGNVEKTRLLISSSTNMATAEALLEGHHSLRAIRKDVEKANYVNDDAKASIMDEVGDSVTKSLERMSQTTSDKIVVKSLINMLNSQKLEVRVYPKEKLHAKAYIFKSKSSSFVQGVAIVGSSNLSIAGISQNSELNLKTYHSPDLRQLLTWFDKLWDASMPFSEQLNTIMSKSWAGKTYSPRDLFLKAAYIEYKDKLEEQHKIDPVWDRTFPNLFPFQKQAVDQCLTLFELYRGVIIGDVVGLGKTYVGIALMKYLQMQRYRPLVICPPSLVPMWEKFCEEYEVDAKVMSRGMLSQENFDLYKDYRYKSRNLVLIDESHHFRNHTTRQYDNMLHFMQARDAHAILLTATPLSNKADDIKNQIMLFHQSTSTSIPPANETDLDTFFKQVRNGEADLVELLRNIMIRRTRRYVINQWGSTDENGRKYLTVANTKMYFPERKMKTSRYDINIVYRRKYKTIVGHLDEENLTLARYSVGRYLKSEYQNVDPYRELSVVGPKLVGLIRTLLLKRMESSIEAFRSSIRHYINTHSIFIKLVEEGIMPIGDASYTSMYEIAQTDPDSINDPETIEEFRKKIRKAGGPRYKLEAFNVDDLIAEIQNDIETFEKIDGLISRLTPQTDEKLKLLQKLLDKHSDKKVIVFTEFTTTAKYLDKHLTWPGVKSQVDSETNNLIQAARLFDPKNNPGYRDVSPSEEITLLITTDVLAEGVNLQAGNVVINYDFHWNPTRLIQRAGRIDRIGSDNATVTVHNFLLDPTMEEDLGLEFAVDAKIDQIQRLIGEDYKILKEDEKINTADNYAIYSGDGGILDREDANPLEPSNIEKLLLEIQSKNPELWKQIQLIPNGIRSSSPFQTGRSGSLLLACESMDSTGEKFQKYYIISDDLTVRDVRVGKVLEWLDSDDSATHPLPDQYDKLLEVGWNKFIDDMKQVEARSGLTRLRPVQAWIVERLLKIGAQDEFSAQKHMIEALRQSFSMPITKRQLRNKLNKIRSSNMNDGDLLDALSHLYRDYDLQNQGTRHADSSFTVQRILYSKYIYGDVK